VKITSRASFQIPAQTASEQVLTVVFAGGSGKKVHADVEKRLDIC
jgi:hypothetical protein